jgi:hypothetical protein
MIRRATVWRTGTAGLVAAWVVAWCAPAEVLAADPGGTHQPTVLMVVGAPGEEAFGDKFAAWAGQWQHAATRARAATVTIGLDTNTPPHDRDTLREALARERKEGPAELWLVLLGHGTFGGREAKFNLRGPDISTSNLVEWLKPFRRPVGVIDCSAASAPFMRELSGPDRVIVTATRSGNEQNFAYLGQYLAESIADSSADLDKDGQTSLLEAWLMASRRTREFYETEGRLATEHSLLDDNGDGLGTPSDWFRGIRAVKKAKEGAALDGLRAHQFHLVRSAAEEKMPPELRARRDALELKLAGLRDQKSQMNEDEYYSKLEAIVFDIARLCEEADR